MRLPKLGAGEEDSSGASTTGCIVNFFEESDVRDADAVDFWLF